MTNPQDKYRLILTTDTGSRIGNPISPIGSGFTAMRKANTISPVVVELPRDAYFRLFTVANPKKYMLQVWRQADGGVWRLFNNYIITKYERRADPTPHGSVFLHGYDTNWLLSGRIVAAYKASANARITDYADDMLKGLLTDAMSDLIAPVPTAGTRAWANLSVSGDVSAGPELTLDLEYKKLLTKSGGGAFKDIVNASREADTDLFFEVQPNKLLEKSIDFVFNTFVGQIGADLTDSVTFSIANSTIENAVVVYDYTDEENYIYAGGTGQENVRTIAQAYNADAYGSSIWGRREGFLDVPGTDDASLQDAANAHLIEMKATVEAKGKIVDTPQLRFGRDFDFGDLVTAVMYGDQYEAMISAVTVGVTDGVENVDITAEYRS